MVPGAIDFAGALCERYYGAQAKVRTSLPKPKLKEVQQRGLRQISTGCRSAGTDRLAGLEAQRNPVASLRRECSKKKEG